LHPVRDDLIAFALYNPALWTPMPFYTRHYDVQTLEVDCVLRVLRSRIFEHFGAEWGRDSRHAWYNARRMASKMELLALKIFISWLAYEVISFADLEGSNLNDQLGDVR
jgi:hypothetical protein